MQEINAPALNFDAFPKNSAPGLQASFIKCIKSSAQVYWICHILLAKIYSY